MADALQVATVVGAVLAPILVYAVGASRVRLEARRDRRDEDQASWERMAQLVEQYAAQAEGAARDAETVRERLNALRRELEELRGLVASLRAYTAALRALVLDLGGALPDPGEFGLRE